MFFVLHKIDNIQWYIYKQIGQHQNKAGLHMLKYITHMVSTDDLLIKYIIIQNIANIFVDFWICACQIQCKIHTN